MHQHSHYRGKERKKGPKKILEEIIAEKFPNIGKEIVDQVQETQSSRQDEHKEEKDT